MSNFSVWASWRYISASIVVVTAVAAVNMLCVVPYECNLKEKRWEAITLAMFERRNGSSAERQVAQRTLSEMQRCLKSDPNANLCMIAAANYRLLGRNSEAVRLYETALQYDRRPEIYYNIGETQLDAGIWDEAIKNLSTAVYFNPFLADNLPEVAPETGKFPSPEHPERNPRWAAEEAVLRREKAILEKHGIQLTNVRTQLYGHDYWYHKSP